MRTVGIIFTGFVGLLVVIGLLVGVRSIPDVRRYFRMRSM